VVLIMIVAVIILLALPASHPYFRKADEVQWEPPVPPAPDPYYGAPTYQQPAPPPSPPSPPGPEDPPPPAGPTGPPPSWPPSS